MRFPFSRHAAIAVLLTLPLLILAVPIASRPAEPQQAPALQPDVFRTHVSTDKPIYRAGETLYGRAVVLNADRHTPSPAGTVRFHIRGPKGDIVHSGVSNITDSTVGFSWSIPGSQPGGEYTIRIQPSSGEAPAERTFEIRAYRAPRLKAQIVFLRDGYGPGDEVQASVHVERAEGGVPAGASVSATALVDGAPTWTGNTSVDKAGNATITFKLAENIARGEGTLSMTINDGASVETAARTLPIFLQTVDLAIYPEGGDLIGGLSNRVYLEARTPSQKPADIAGVVIDASGMQVAQFRTEHEGRGRFAFVPASGKTYSLRITEPSGIRKVFTLPVVKGSGVVLSSIADVVRKGQDVNLKLAASHSGTFNVVVSQRGRSLAARSLSLTTGRATNVALILPDGIEGVITATVYDEKQKPLAERLLFREPESRLHIRVTPERTDYVPGDRVTLRISTTDDSGKPASATVGVTVTDSSILEMIDKREQAPRLPAMVLLEGDVQSLGDAGVYLDETNPKSAMATDLLLGTQGWRRFATIDVTRFLSQYGDAARRALAVRIDPPTSSLAGDALLLPEREEDLLAYLANLAAGQGVPAGNILIDGFENAQMRAVKEEFAEKDVAGKPIQGIVGNIADRIAVADLRARQALAIDVREYAHALRPNWTPDSRSDFAETAYWNAAVRTNAETGTASVSFNLSDAVTSFRVLADGFMSTGALGSATTEIESRRAFYVEPKLPLQLTTGDVLQLPIGLVNGSGRTLSGTSVTLHPAAGLEFSALGHLADLRPNERSRQSIIMRAGLAGDWNIILDAAAGGYRDTVTRTIQVQPAGFPAQATSGGVLNPNSSTSFVFTLPEGLVSGSVTSSITVYPTPLANMTQALQALLQQPYGCFEQTSSTSYPMVMAQQYFLSHSGVDASLIEKTRGLLETSYKRLVGFETPTKGYEWFGADPGHEALTAYGLMQFSDMSAVRTVDAEMVRRTRAWLLSRRDGNGGFKLNSKAVDSFGHAPAETTNAYIVWALTEAGERGLDKEIASAKALAGTSKDSYIIALVANTLYATGDKSGARLLMDRLASVQAAEGHVNGAVTSITRSGGQALSIETTALAALAWLREPAYSENVERAIRWLAQSNKDGRFASTQSTILALRSIIAYDAVHARPKAAGRVILTVDGKAIGAPISFDANTQGALVFPDLGNTLGPGRHTAVLAMESGSSMPFSIAVKYHNTLPDSAPESKVGIQVALANASLREGAVTEAHVSITNRSTERIPAPVAIVGIPGGLEVRHDQLKELVKAGKTDAYEVIGREVVLYWRSIGGGDRLAIPLSLVAAVPGTYAAPASRAYLYYTDEYKDWAPGVSVTITPDTPER